MAWSCGFLNDLRHVLPKIKFNHHHYVNFKPRVSQGYSQFCLFFFKCHEVSPNYFVARRGVDRGGGGPGVPVTPLL